MADEREHLGRIVRDTWVAWASGQPDPKPSWLVPFDELDDGQREVDMRIGEAVAAAERERIAELARCWDVTVYFDADGDETAAGVPFADRIRDDTRHIVSAPGMSDLEAIGNGPLLDPWCRYGAHASCMGPPCECPVPGVHSARHEHERSQPS